MKHNTWQPIKTDSRVRDTVRGKWLRDKVKDGDKVRGDEAGNEVGDDEIRNEDKGDDEEVGDDKDGDKFRDRFRGQDEVTDNGDG